MFDRWSRQIMTALGVAALGFGLPFGVAEAARGRLIYHDGIFERGPSDVNAAIILALILTLVGAVFYAAPLLWTRQQFRLESLAALFLVSLLVQGVDLILLALLTARSNWEDGVGYVLLALVIGGALASLMVARRFESQPKPENS